MGFAAINLRDVGVIERSENLRLTLEPGQTIRIVAENVGHNLDGNVTSKLRVVRSEHNAHSAFAERRLDLVASDSCANCKSHEVAGLYCNRLGRTKPSHFLQELGRQA